MRYTKTLSLLLLLCTKSALATSQPDSLLNIYNTTTLPDTTRLKALSSVIRFYHAQNPDSAEYYARNGLKFSIARKLPKWKANMFNQIGLSYFYRGKYTQALDYYFKCLNIREKLKDDGAIAAALTNIGNVYGYMHQELKALAYFKRAYKLASNVNDTYVMTNSMGNMAVIYQKLPDSLAKKIGLTKIEQTKKALTYNELCMQYAERENMTSAVAICLGNMGAIYSAMDDTIAAALGISPEKKYQLALGYHQRNLKIVTELNDTYSLAYTYNNLAALQVRLKNYASAIPLAEKGLMLAREVKDIDTEKDISNILYLSYKATGKNQLALQFYEQYIKLRDSIFNIENREEIARRELEYEFGKKAAADSVSRANQNLVNEAKLKTEKMERREERATLYTAIVTAVVIALLVILILNQRRLKLKKRSLEEKQELLNRINLHQKELLNTTVNVQETERKRIASELHDGIGGLLSTVKINLDSYVNKLPAEPSKEMLHSVTLLDEACADLRTISHNMMPVVLLKMGLIRAVHDFVSKVNAAKKIQLRFETTGTDERMDENTEIALFRVVQEAVNNIIKHAGATRADIQFIRHENMLTVMIEDNGKGFNTNATIGNSIGLKSITSRIAYLGGKTIFDSSPGKGTSIIIELPYLTAEERDSMAS